MSEAGLGPEGGASERRIRFVDRIADSDVVLMAFEEPARRYAVLSGTAARVVGEAAGDAHEGILEVVLLPPGVAWPEAPPETGQAAAGAQPPIYVKYRGVELMWGEGRALLQCDPELADSLVAAVVEFTHYESELRQIEGEVAAAWGELEQDKALTFEVKPADLERSEAVGARMNQTLGRRIRLARMEAHLYEPEATLPATARKLGEELRDKARIEARLEIVDGQLEIFEDVYEMSGQRMGEYRAARQEHVLEWIIIVLLAAELALLLAQTVWKLAG